MRFSDEAPLSLYGHAMMPARFPAAMLALLLPAAPAARAEPASRPHVSEVRPLALPDGSPGRIELLHGDGFIAADPVRAQVRDSMGRVLAWTPAGVAAALSCPEAARTDACRAFVFGQAPWPTVWVPDPAGYAPDARAPAPVLAGDWAGPFPGFDTQPASIGFRRAGGITDRAWGMVLLVLAFWRAMLLSAGLLAGAAMALHGAVRQRARPVLRIGLWAIAAALITLAGFQGMVLVLLIGFPVGLLVLLWVLAGLGWLGLRRAA